MRDWADAGLFPNRCEGGTNLVAMEAMASGLPVILSGTSARPPPLTPNLPRVRRAVPRGFVTDAAVAPWDTSSRILFYSLTDAAVAPCDTSIL